MAAAITYWIDRSLGAYDVPEALRAAGITIVTYRELYPDNPSVEDAEWIPTVTANGWVIVTKDKRIRHRPAEIEVLRRVRARYVCLSAGNLRGDEQAACLRGHWERIERVVATKPAPLIVTVSREKVQWLDGDVWRAIRSRG